MTISSFARPVRVCLAALALLTVATVAPNAASAADAPARQPTGLRFLGEQQIPFGTTYASTPVGGLSGISYDARSGTYYLISDDRSALAPTRFYTAEIGLKNGKLGPVQLTGTKPLLDQDGSTFPATDAAKGTIAPDAEGIAVDPRSGNLWWTSEGERVVGADGTALADPWLRSASPSGTYLGQAEQPPQFHVNTQEVGPRRNMALEGLSITRDGRTLYTAMEDPLYQDGALPSVAKGALTRITRYDLKTQRPQAQFAYPLEKQFQAGAATDTNGLTDVLALDDGNLLVIERASVYAENEWKVRIYLASPQRATNVLSRDTLTDDVRPMSKKLLLDLDSVKGLPVVDNVEGITFGPRLKDGTQTVVLVSDNNFNEKEVTQVIALGLTYGRN
ncbi:esterase-like activity of phytase family protein [Kineosporia babensis]|uniref:Esterase-like activity of phytase family protein n=1 Tax=Kineosporia babensis TaxID=499548 RepID=A0A9X1ND60_9ACTN|nr:esterase-like activity of phytase family protein [Kineosporia babensis]